MKITIAFIYAGLASAFTSGITDDIYELDISGPLRRSSLQKRSSSLPGLAPASRFFAREALLKPTTPALAKTASTPPKQAPAKQTPAKQAPAKQAPAKQAPAKQAPAKQALNKIPLGQVPGKKPVKSNQPSAKAKESPKSNRAPKNNAAKQTPQTGLQPKSSLKSASNQKPKSNQQPKSSQQAKSGQLSKNNAIKQTPNSPQQPKSTPKSNDKGLKQTPGINRQPKPNQQFKTDTKPKTNQTPKTKQTSRPDQAARKGNELSRSKGHGNGKTASAQPKLGNSQKKAPSRKPFEKTLGSNTQRPKAAANKAAGKQTLLSKESTGSQKTGPKQAPDTLGQKNRTPVSLGFKKKQQLDAPRETGKGLKNAAPLGQATSSMKPTSAGPAKTSNPPNYAKDTASSAAKRVSKKTDEITVASKTDKNKSTSQKTEEKQPNYQKSTKSSRNKQVNKNTDEDSGNKLCKRTGTCSTSQAAGDGAAGDGTAPGDGNESDTSSNTRGPSSKRPLSPEDKSKSNEAGTSGNGQSDSDASSTTQQPPSKRLKLTVNTNSDSTASSKNEEPPSSPEGISPTTLIQQGGLPMTVGGAGQMQENAEDQKSKEYSSEVTKLSRRPDDDEVARIGLATAKTLVQDPNASVNDIGDVTISTKTGKGNKDKQDDKERTYIDANTSRVRNTVGVPPDPRPVMQPIIDQYKKDTITHGEIGAHPPVNEQLGYSPITDEGEMGRTISFNIHGVNRDPNMIVPQASCKDDRGTNAACRYTDLASDSYNEVDSNRKRIKAATNQPAEQDQILQEALKRGKKRNENPTAAQKKLQDAAQEVGRIAVANKAENEDPQNERRSVILKRALQQALFRRCNEEGPYRCRSHARGIAVRTVGPLVTLQRRSAFIRAY